MSLNISNLYSPHPLTKLTSKEVDSTTTSPQTETSNVAVQTTSPVTAHHLRAHATLFANFAKEDQAVVANIEAKLLAIKEKLHLTEKENVSAPFTANPQHYVEMYQQGGGDFSQAVLSATELANVFDFSNYQKEDIIVQASKTITSSLFEHADTSLLSLGISLRDNLNLKYDEQAELTALKQLQTRTNSDPDINGYLNDGYIFQSKNSFFKLDPLKEDGTAIDFSLRLGDKLKAAGAFANLKPAEEAKVNSLLSQSLADLKPVFNNTSSMPGKISSAEAQLLAKITSKALDVIEKNLIDPSGQAAFHKVSSEFKSFLHIKTSLYQNYEEGEARYDEIWTKRVKNVKLSEEFLAALRNAGTFRTLGQVAHSTEATDTYRQALNHFLDQLDKLDKNTDVNALLTKFEQANRAYYTNDSADEQLLASYRLNFQSFDHIKTYWQNLQTALTES